MSKILFRAGKSPLTPLTHEQSLGVSRLGVFGSNAGNMLFYSAVHRALSTPGAEIITDGYRYERREATKDHLAMMNAEYDRYVLPLANSFRHTFLPHLNRYTELFTKLRIPVHVIGVGAQMPYGTSFDSLDSDYKKTVQQFVRAVLDLSPSIGVRGEYTADLLRYLGFGDEQVYVIGCPSMYMYGQAEPMREPYASLSEDAKIALNYTPKVPGMADWLAAATDTYANSVVVPQQHQRLALMLWAEDSPTKEDPRLPIRTSHPLFRQDRMRMFVDAHTWIDYLRDYDFVVGTRLHGNIAGILAQSPSLLLAHDSRTAELAEYHGIPYRIAESLDSGMDLKKLYQELDFTPFEKAQEPTFKRYVRFLDDHGLTHIFDGKNENPAYDEALENAPLAGPVHTLMAGGELGREQVNSRLAWLRQGALGDRSRPVYAFKPPVNTRSKRLDITRLEERIRKLEAALAESEARAARFERAVKRSAPSNPSLVVKARRILNQIFRRGGRA